MVFQVVNILAMFVFFAGISVAAAKTCIEAHCASMCVEQANYAWWAMGVHVAGGVYDWETNFCKCITLQGQCLNC
ncbi:hypothetical protein [Heliothis virescens ascovirus 3h]|uniref:Uncharacterized protein n=1 Tax=Heliothis virescens ascovirus 3h TaxID=1268039 RepID=A0A386JAI6_9VIRU|nr:hypothetical protein [Heliothis virescens ascovirus 3h]